MEQDPACTYKLNATVLSSVAVRCEFSSEGDRVFKSIQRELHHSSLLTVILRGLKVEGLR